MTKANEEMKSENPDSAIVKFKIIKDLNSRDPHIEEHIVECDSLIVQKNIDNKPPEIPTQTIIKGNLQEAKAYNNKGLRYSAMGDNDKAIEAYNKAIDLNPKYQQAYRNRAIQYIRKGNDYAALKDANEAIRLAPNDGDNYCTRGDVYNMQKIYEAAIKDFTKAIELYDKVNSVIYSDGKSTITHSKNTLKASTYYRRGLAHSMAGKKDAAEYDFNQANLLDSANY